ncbi:MAG: MIase like protein [Chloroflexi bacterium]|nr:MIase like protein [Chloroflexota bacterium]
MLYFVRFEIHQPEGMSAGELRRYWDQEAQTALKLRNPGPVKGLWKVSGQRVVLAVLDLPDNDVLDQALASLPIMESMGGSVKVEALPIRPYENFAADLRKAVGGT